MKSILRALWAGWKRFGFILGTINRFILLTVFYWVVIDVANIGLRLLRKDLLDRRMVPKPTYWHPKPAAPATYQHQF